MKDVEEDISQEDLGNIKVDASAVMESMRSFALPSPDEAMSDKEQLFCIERVIKGATIQNAYINAFGREEGCSSAAVYPYEILKKPKVKKYIAKLVEYKNNVRDMTFAMSDDIMSLQTALVIMSKAANGEIKMSQSQHKALDTMIRVHGGYKQKEKQTKRPINVNIYSNNDGG